MKKNSGSLIHATWSRYVQQSIFRGWFRGLSSICIVLSLDKSNWLIAPNVGMWFCANNVNYISIFYARTGFTKMICSCLINFHQFRFLFFVKSKDNMWLFQTLYETSMASNTLLTAIYWPKLSARPSMLKSCLLAILLDMLNHPSGETGSIYEANVKWNSTGLTFFQFTSIQNMNEDNGHSSWFLLVN